MNKLNTVLLVDDDKITNFINQRLIQKLGVAEAVKVVANGKEAFEFLKVNSEDHNNIPDFILLDINMPVMDGFEFIDLFKTMHLGKRIVIVMLTTSSNEKDIERISNTPEIAGYINKPLTDSKLKDALEKYY